MFSHLRLSSVVEAAERSFPELIMMMDERRTFSYAERFQLLGLVVSRHSSRDKILIGGYVT